MRVVRWCLVWGLIVLCCLAMPLTTIAATPPKPATPTKVDRNRTARPLPPTKPVATPKPTTPVKPAAPPKPVPPPKPPMPSKAALAPKPPARARLPIRTLAGPTLVVATTNDTNVGVNCLAATDNCSLRDTIRIANMAGNAGSTITFDATTFPIGTLETITLTMNLTLTITQDVTITGTSLFDLAVDGNCTTDMNGNCTTGGATVFTVQSGANVAISDMTIQHGNAPSGSGGGIRNAGTLTLTNCALDENSAGGGNGGGGIYSTGTLTLTNCALDQNSANGAGVDGGAITNDGGTLIITGSNITNSATTGTGDGGGIASLQGGSHTTITNSAIAGNQSGNTGGGIVNAGTMTVTGSTFAGNGSLGNGAGIANRGTLTVTNSSVFINTVISGTGTGGGIANGPGANLTVLNSTIAGNDAASPNTGGIATPASGATALLVNTVVAYNGNNPNPDLTGTFSLTSKNNLIEDGTGGNLTNGTNNNIVGNGATPIDPLLAIPDFYPPGTQPTAALLPGSPAIDAGDDGTCQTTTGTAPVNNQDERGISRTGFGAHCDIGSFESQGFVLAYVSGDGQSANLFTPFPNPLVVSVTANGAGEPVEGGTVTFTGPASGNPGIQNSPVIAFINSSGKASALVTANGNAGAYVVNASTPRATPANIPFSLTNNAIVAVSCVVTSTQDPTEAGKMTLRDAVNVASMGACMGGNTITFSPAVFPPGGPMKTITLDANPINQTLTLGADTTITGPGAGALAVDGGSPSLVNSFSIFTVNPGVTATLSGMTIQHGVGFFGGGIWNQGALTVLNCALTNNNAPSGGSGAAIYNTGSLLTVTSSTFTGNTADQSGGGIENLGGTLKVTNSAFNQNASANATGGGIDNFGGNATVTGSTFTGNTADGPGGGIENESGTLNVTGSAFIRNSSASETGGGIDYFRGDGTVASSTFTGNTADEEGGGIENDKSILVVTGSIFSQNSSTTATGGGIDTFKSTLTVTNSTFTGNTAFGSPSGGGGAILNESGTLTVTNSTIVGNSAAGDPAAAGGGVDDGCGCGITLTNTIVAGNTATTGPDVNGPATGTNNLIGDGSNLTGISDGTNGNHVGTTAAPFNPLLGPLGAYGGSTQTFALLPGSPAIDAGIGGAGIPTTDQRGIIRPQGGGVDIGAFESQGFTLTIAGGTPQTTPFSTAFALPLQVTAASSHNEPVQGGKVTFTVTPAGNGASAILTGSPATINASGGASVTATANNVIGGPYTVTATTTGAPSVAFSLTNGPMVISPATLPAGTKGIAYPPQTVTVIGGTAPYAFTVSVGTLPGGLTLNPTTGVLAGTPTATGTFPFTVQVKDAQNLTGTQAYSVTIAAAPLTSIALSAPFPNSPTNVTGKVGQGVQLTATGTFGDNSTSDLTSQVTWTSSNPSIATVDASGKVIGQSPGTVTITATLNGITQTITITVAGPTPIGIQVPPAPANRPSGTTSQPGASPAPAPNGSSSGTKPGGPAPNPAPGGR